MKLQKVFVVLGISVCLIATEMQATFGIGEEPQPEEESEMIEEEQEEQEVVKAVQEEPEAIEIVQGDEQAYTEEPVQPAEQEEPGPEAGTEITETEAAEEPVQEEVPVKKEELTEAGEAETEENGASGTGEIFILEDNTENEASEEEIPKEEDDTEEEVPKEDDGTGEEVPKEDDGTGEEVPKEDDGTGEEVPKEDDGTGEEIPKEDDGIEEEIPKEEDGIGEELPKEEDSSGGHIVIDNSQKEDTDKTKDTANTTSNAENIKQRVKNTQAEGKTSKHSNMFSSFTPSSEFIDDREKVKYNVDIPVDGLPGFITQEMLVGALKCQDETGYPASVTIAQIIQESGFGKYGPDGDKGQGLSYLAYQYNNLFGIKGSGTAGSVAMNTGEQRLDGSRYSITAGFRVYNTYTECIEDRTGLLERVYKDLTFGVKDANTFAMKIGSRWATSLSYGQNLIRQMDRYDLYRLDAMTLDEFSGMIGTFANPCPGARLTSDFGYREAPLAGASTYHKGIDLGTGACNIPTYAAEAGTVTYAGPGGAAGNLVTIDHGNGLVTKYMHHDRVYVKVGDGVQKGQQIGLSGTTGNSTGNHLHFQVEKDGVVVNPMYYLDMQK